MEATKIPSSMQTGTENSPQFSVWRMLVGCVVAFCAVSLWIIIAFPGRALDLWFYSAYMTIACTFFPLPTPQMAMIYGRRFSPASIAILGGIGSCISGLIDYALVTIILRFGEIARTETTRTYRYIARIKMTQVYRYIERNTKRAYRQIEQKTTLMYRYIDRLFKMAPFIILVIAAFTPIPFEPVKLLACATRYNRVKFVAAIFVGRTPRYLLLGLLQRKLEVPAVFLWGSIFILLMIDVVRRFLKKSRRK